MITRRDFVTQGISVGFALAAGPISALTINTDLKGITAGDIKIPQGTETIPGYWAMPQGKGPFPVLIVVHEIFGLHEHIRDVCRRFAKRGVLAVAPYLYFRQGDVVSMKDINEIIEKVVSKVSMDQVCSDIDATIAFVKQSGKGNLAKTSITGFCWGGATTWLYSSRHPELKAGVAWYGPLVNPDPKRPSPVTIAPTLKVPVLGLYGGKDGHITPDHVKAMEAALSQGSSGSKIIVYPDAPHGFNADYRDSYRKADSEAATKEMFSWLKSHGAV